MKRLLVILYLLDFIKLYSQENAIRVGDQFPDYILRPVINTSSQEVDVHKLKNKFIILNFWGTWCSPCLPEMETLGKLQKKYKNNVQVIAISNDDITRLQAYLKKRPTEVLLVSDTAQFLYRQINFSYIGQSIILNPQKKVIALVRSDSITQSFMERLIAGKAIQSSGEVEGKIADTEKDPFGVDSSLATSVSIRSYMVGYHSMSLNYQNTALAGRRKTYFNICPLVLFKDAFDIRSESQVVYEIDEKKFCNFSDKSTLVCFDLLVKETMKDSFKLIMQQKLNGLFPVKGRIEYKKLPVLLLKQTDSTAKFIKSSAAADSLYMFTGKGFTGEAVHVSTFTEYLANEFGLPVINDTGLMERYNIKTENLMRTKDEITRALERIGFKIEKGERLMPVLIIY